MKKTITAILLFCALGLSAHAQTSYVPTCLTPAQVATVTQSTAALAPILLFDETDAALRLADAQCVNVKTATGLLADVAQLKTQVPADAAKETADVAALQTQAAAIKAAQAADAANIATLQGQVNALAQPSSTILVTTAQLSASVPAVRLDYASCVPTTPVVGWITAGEINDFTFNVPAAGNYLITACEASSGAATYHFEYPIGTKIGASLTAINTGAWHTFALQSATAPVALPAGSVTVRVVFESAGMNLGNLSFAKQ